MKQAYLILSLAVSVILCSAVQSNATDLADGQIAHFPFNGNAVDESGNGHDGTVNGATLTTDRFGNADSAYAFDGINDYIRIGSEPNVSMMTNYAVSVWFLNDGGGSFGNYGQKVLDKTSLYHDFYLAVRNTGALRYHLYEGTSASVNDSSYDYRDSAWHHAVIQTRANIMSMWVDGVYVGAASNAMPVSSTSDLLIGYTDSSDALQRVFWSGSIDDMRIYNRVLSEQEIQELVNESDSADSGGLIAHYPFNGNADDESGNGHDGTVNGATLTTDRFGNANSAYAFDGVNNYISIADHADFTVTDVSICAWVKTTDKSDMKHITSCYGTGADSQWYNLWLTSGAGTVRIGADPGGAVFPVPFAVGTTDITDDRWHYVVGVRDTSTLQLKVYVDGILENSTADISASALDPEVDLWIGGQNGWPTRYFNGDIDDVSIYNRALSEEEVAELYDLEEDGDGLVAHFPFNGNAVDESGNGHDGTVNGATLTTDRFGNADSAYHFDGINDYIRIGSEPNVSMMTNYAVSVWFLNDGGGSFGNYGQKVLDKTSLYHDFYLAVRNTGALRYHLYEGTSAGVNDSSYDYRDSAWHHAVIQTRANIMSMWVDGVYVGAASNAMPVSSTSDLLIGYTDSSDALQRVFWSGSIDDMRIYNRVLSEQEIQELVNESDSADSGGLIAHYPFNGNAADESGNGHDGAVSGATLTADRFGNADSAYRFDGADDLVIIPDHTDFTVTDISIAAWIRTTDKSEHRHITSCYGTGWNSEWYNLYYRKDTGAAAWQVDPGGINPPTPHTFGSTDVADGEWHLLVGVRDTSSSIVKIYVDGVLQNSGPDISAEALDPDVDFWIGGQNGWPTRFFNGDIDDVRIYNRALSVDEVSTLYSDGLPSAPMLEIYTDVLTNTLVVAGEAVSRTMTLTNAGNAQLEFSFCTAAEGNDDGLVANYPFNGNADDESGNGHDGTVAGATLAPDRFGNPDSAYYFNGSDAQITLPQDGPLNFERNEPFSESFWLNSSSYSGSWGKNMISKMMTVQPATGVLTSMIYGHLRFRLASDISAGNFLALECTTTINDGEWHHVAVTYDGSSDADGVTVYIDGALESTTYTANALTGSILNDSPQTVGARDGYNHYDGLLDDMRFYNRVLTEQEVQELYSETDDGLVAHYPFNGNAADESGNGADGIIEGALPTTDRHGNENEALWFDEDRYVRTTASSGSVDITGRISMAAWINPSQFETKDGAMGMRRTILRKMSLHNSYGYVFGINQSGELNTYFGNSSNGGPAVTALNMTPLSMNRWSHVAATYDGALVTFYVDGVIVDVQPCDVPLRSTSENLCIGRIPDADTAYFYGAIDDIHLYDRALLADEIAGLFAEGDDGLVANYPFNGDATDESGNGYNGTVTGATLAEDRFGNADSAYHFDGVNDYIDIGEFAGIKSVSMWVKQGTRSEFEFYFGHNTFRVYASTLANGRLMFGDGSPNKVYSAVSMDDYEDQWVHVVAVGDGLNSRVYLNGVNVTESSGNVGPALASVVNLGRWPGPNPAATHYMNGDIDDVHIYDRVLSESEVLELYAEESVSACMLPEWLSVEPKSGTVAPGESMDINLTYSATNQVAGDYLEHVLQLLSNDPEYPVVGIPVSMWVTPSVPELFAEPQCTVGKSNEVAWVVQDGPVEYWAEAEAIQHCTPSSCTDSNGVPDGWLNLNSYAENPEDWFKDSGWIDSTSYWFTGLRLNNVYQYRVKASVVTAIGRLESDWSNWTSSAQVPVILDHNGDHVPGWWKRWYFGTEDNFISSMDSDGDQLCDYYEYISGSNPHDARSKFKIGKGKAHQNGDFVVNWDSVTGRVYNVYWSPDVVGPYELLEADIAYPQNSCTDTVHHAESGAFYRIDVSLDN